MLAAIGCLLVPAVAAYGQRGGGLPSDLKTAVDAKPRQAEIDKFVAAQLARLQNPKAQEQQAARDLLVRESAMVGGTVSPSYAVAYATALNNQLLKLAKTPDPRFRLNAAIVLQRVARNVNNGALAGAAAELAADPCAGVSLWATKGSQAILPPVAATGKRTKLTGAIVSGVRKHADQGDLAEEAYRALTLELRSNPQKVTAAAISVVLPDVLKLFQSRVEQYATSTPPNPGLEERGAIFLTFSRVWSHPDAAKLQPAIMQQLSNLVGLSAQHVAAREQANARKEFTDLMRGVGEAMLVVSGPEAMKDADLQAAAQSLTKVGPGMENDGLTALADTTYAAIKARFPKTAPFPTIQEGAATETEVEETPAAAPREEAEPAAGEEDSEAEPDPAADESTADAPARGAARSGRNGKGG